LKSKDKLFRGKMMMAVVLTVLMVVMTLMPTMAMAESGNGGGILT
jgi:hypothetical protein